LIRHIVGFVVALARFVCVRIPVSNLCVSIFGAFAIQTSRPLRDSTHASTFNPKMHIAMLGFQIGATSRSNLALANLPSAILICRYIAFLALPIPKVHMFAMARDGSPPLFVPLSPSKLSHVVICFNPPGLCYSLTLLLPHFLRWQITASADTPAQPVRGGLRFRLFPAKAVGC
jgi:hypothetical protein